MELLNFSEKALCILTIIAVCFPIGSFLLLLLDKRLSTGPIAIAASSVSFLSSLVIFLNVWDDRLIHQHIEWFTIGNREFTAGILLNNLSVMMMVVVSGIALLVHIYSTSYMKGDTGIHKYWAYLGLFCFAMMGLVVSDSLLIIYMFWELVGFSSYLLIGFWFVKETAAQAAKKAFIMNRIGDIGFLTGIMIIYAQFGTFDMEALFGAGGLVDSATIADGVWISTFSQMPHVWLCIAGAAIFMGVIAKSAQFPLHTWLPDAMEGPTPVSSLLHAATMVAAGVFLLARAYPIFDSLVLNFITIIGVLTALMGATVALTQNDIKRILAYSTISQLGFMIAAMGMGAYGESIFHLATHAFFKCLLFLSAGAVIHQLHHYKEQHRLEFDHQDVREMGGLMKQMPIAFTGMCLGAGALAGLPLTSGYLSKDALLITSFEWAQGYHGLKKLVPYLLVLTSWVTAFYAARLIFKVFFGKPRFEGIHDAPSAMRYVLVVLAVCCSFLLFNFNPFSYGSSWILDGFMKAGVKRLENLHVIIPVIVTIISVILVFVAYKIYVVKSPAVSRERGRVYFFFNRGWYLDGAYSLLFVSPVERLSRWSYKFDWIVIDGAVKLLAALVSIISGFSNWIDRYIVDGLVNAIAALARNTGDFARQFQSGKVQHYLITMLTIVVSFFIINYFI